MLCYVIILEFIFVNYCISVEESSLFLYTPKPAVLNKELTLICQTSSNVTGVRWNKNRESVALTTLNDCSGGSDFNQLYRFSCKSGQFTSVVPYVNNAMHLSLWNCANLFGGLSNNLTVYVQVPVTEVKFSEGPTVLEVTEGEVVELSCISGLCRPPANVSLMGTPETIEETMPIVERNYTSDMYKTSGTWKLTTTKNENGLRVRCKAYNLLEDVGYVVSNSIVLDVKHGPGKTVTHSLDTESVNITEQESLTPLICSASCNPPCSFSWWKKGHQVSNDRHLLLLNVSKQASGIYICNASNNIGNGFAEMEIKVMYQPKIVDLRTSHDKILESDTVEIQCRVDSFPPSKISWYKDKVKIASDQSSINTQDVLTIQHAECTDTGNYTCEAENDIGVQVSKSVSVFVYCSPRLNPDVNRPEEQDIYASIGSFVSFNAYFIAYPAPEVSWYFWHNTSEAKSSLSANGRIEFFQETNIIYHKYFLIIYEVNEKDFGGYKIAVSNRYGRLTEEFNLREKDINDRNLPNMQRYINYGLILMVAILLVISVLAVIRYHFLGKRRGNADTDIEASEEEDDYRFYENEGRLIELSAVGPYNDLSVKHDATHYSTVKEAISADSRISEDKESSTDESCDYCDSSEEFDREPTDDNSDNSSDEPVEASNQELDNESGYELPVSDVSRIPNVKDDSDGSETDTCKDDRAESRLSLEETEDYDDADVLD